MADVSRTFTLHQEAAHAPHHYDLEDLIPDVFDTTNNALRIRTTAADVACAGTSDARQVFEIVYDQTRHCLNVVSLGASASAKTDLDWQQVIKACLDTDKSKLNLVT